MTFLHRNQSRCWMLVLSGCLAAATLSAQQTNAPAAFSKEFIRFTKTGTDEGHVDTAVKSYFRDKDQVVVTLASVVHVGDAGYYERLQQLFESFDAVLYEMIRDEDAVPVRGEQSDHPISQLQIGMKTMLDLEFQLDRIDYTRTNFVHADLSPDAFAALQEDRGESLFGVLFRAALEEQGRLSAHPEEALNPFSLLMALTSRDSSHQLKFLLGQQMANMESMLSGIDRSPDGKGSAILSGRNEHVMKVLGEQMESGKKKLVIFYGAGHMPDLEKRLAEQGFKQATEHWNTAWDIQRKRAKPAPRKRTPSPAPEPATID